MFYFVVVFVMAINFYCNMKWIVKFITNSSFCSLFVKLGQTQKMEDKCMWRINALSFVFSFFKLGKFWVLFSFLSAWSFHPWSTQVIRIPIPHYWKCMKFFFYLQAKYLIFWRIFFNGLDPIFYFLMPVIFILVA